MSSEVQLVGLDFGTTTSSAVIASARLARNSVTGRMQLDQVRERFRSELVFTPLREDGSIDLQRTEQYLDAWLKVGQVCREDVFGGGALLTGLTAQKGNARALTELVRRRLGNALVATADDPCLESWLAFMGSCAALSRSRPALPILNLDIGGGTTNLALGQAGEVLRTGCLLVGARHIQVAPGTYRIVKLSRYAKALLARLGIAKGPGDTLDENETCAIVDFYLALLEGAVAGRRERFHDQVALLHQQVALRLPTGIAAPVVTLSGGVGELIYDHLRGRPWPSTTYYGDLGIDLARRLLDRALLSRNLSDYQPAAAGRATVYGLLRHSTEVSGSTLFLSRPEALPLPEMPILGTLSPMTSNEQLSELFALLRRSSQGGCLRIDLSGAVAAMVRSFG